MAALMTSTRNAHGSCTAIFTSRATFRGARVRAHWNPKRPWQCERTVVFPTDHPLTMNTARTTRQGTVKRVCTAAAAGHEGHGPLRPRAARAAGAADWRQKKPRATRHGESHQPSGRRWSREFPIPTPFFPFGEGFTPPPTPSPGPGRGRSRRVGASKMARDGSKRASESPR